MNSNNRQLADLEEFPNGVEGLRGGTIVTMIDLNASNNFMTSQKP